MLAKILLDASDNKKIEMVPRLSNNVQDNSY